MQGPSVESAAIRRLRERKEREAELRAKLEQQEQAKISAAIELDKAKARRWLKLIEHCIGIAAGLAAIAGVLLWFYEAGDREEERSVRRSELIARAQSILGSVGVDDRIDTFDNPLIEWSIVTLARYNQPVSLRAKSVSLTGVDLECAKLDIEADELRLSVSTLRNVQILWQGKQLSLEKAIGRDVWIGVALPTEERKQFMENGFIIETQHHSWQKKKPEALAPPIKVNLEDAHFEKLRIGGLYADGQTTATLSTRGARIRDLQLGFGDNYFEFPSLADVTNGPTSAPTNCKQTTAGYVSNFECEALGNGQAFESDYQLRDLRGDVVGEVDCYRG